MKFETYLLRGLFLACLTVCGLILGAMLGSQSSAVRLAGDQPVATPSLGLLLITPVSHCALPADGVVCPRQLG